MLPGVPSQKLHFVYEDCLMSMGIIGKKIGMSQLFNGGEVIPVTVIQAGPCRVVQKKTIDKDGYEAIQLGFEAETKQKRVTKAMAGHFKRAGLPAYRVLREFHTAGPDVGEEVRVDIFKKGELVSITGVSKGKGFAGVMKRHKFAGGPDSHGSMFNRAPGSIGSSAWPSRVWPGKKLPGHMGVERVTVKNLEVVDVRPEQNIILVRGAVPGAKNGILLISKQA